METWDDAAEYLSTTPRGDTGGGSVSPRGASGWSGSTSPRSGAGWSPAQSPRSGFGGSSGLPGDADWEAWNQAYVVPWGAEQKAAGDYALLKTAETAAKTAEMEANAAANPVGSPEQDGWTIQNQWNGSYSRAAADTGVDANFIKSIQRIETGGWTDYTGDEDCTIRKIEGTNKPDCVALNSGIYQSVADSYGMDYEQIRDNPEYAIEAIATVLAGVGNADASFYGGEKGKTVLEVMGGDWLGVARVYHGGRVDGAFVDENGVSSMDYEAQVREYYDELGGQLAPDQTAAPTKNQGMPADQTDRTHFSPVYEDGTVDARPKQGVTSVYDVMGGDDMPVAHEMGSTDMIERTGDEHYYDYAEEDLGFEGNPGVDYALPVGTEIYAPVSGKIVNVGGEFFKDPQGVGDVRIQNEQGDIIVLGNMRTANLKVGDTVGMGDLIGTSGQYDMKPDSNNFHLEVRVKQPDGTYKAAHPEEYFSPVQKTTITPPGQSTSAVTGNPEGQEIANLADDYNGVDYVWGGVPRASDDPKQTGWDCSGFVLWVAEKMGISYYDDPEGVPMGSHYQAQWAIDNDKWVDGGDISTMQPGDIIFIDTGPDGDGGGGQNEVSPKASRATHVGIYLGDGKMINAMQDCKLIPNPQMGVNCGTGTVDLTNSGWGDMIIGHSSMY